MQPINVFPLEDGNHGTAALVFVHVLVIVLVVLVSKSSPKSALEPRSNFRDFEYN